MNIDFHYCRIANPIIKISASLGEIFYVIGILEKFPIKQKNKDSYYCPYKKERSDWLTSRYQSANEKSKSIQIGESSKFTFSLGTCLLFLN